MAASKPTSWLFMQLHILFHLKIWALSLSTMKLISHCLTPVKQLSGLLSLIRFGNLSTPSLFSALHPVIYYEASPKAISERTSYIRVRLEFLRYPHLIAGLFNGRAFGPPWSFTSTSAWTWVGHSVSGLLHTTYLPYSDSLSLRLRTLST